MEEFPLTWRKRFKRALKYAGMDFMTHTSSHGAKYICEDDRKWFERIFWVLMICLSVCTSAFMVSNIYERYTSHATVHILAETHYPTWRIPFPAITICNNNRVLKSRAEALIDNMTFYEITDPSEFLFNLRALAKLHFPDVNIDVDYGGIQDILDFNEMTVEDVMFRVSQPCEEMFERCSWQNEIVNCRDLFEMQKSHLGFCCSFNYIEPNASANASPIHTRLDGPRMGLSLLINPAVDDYYVNSFLSSGVSVHVHDSYVYPDDHIIMKLVPVNKEVLLPIRMSKRMCSADAANLEPATRHCLFEHERKLAYFSKYMDDNCLTECRMNHFLDYCSCIPYFYPLTNHHKVCNIIDSVCILNKYELLHSFKPASEVDRDLVIPDHERYATNAINEEAMACDCPTQCEAVTFDSRVSWGDFSGSAQSINQLFGPETNHTNRILLHIFLESNFSQVTKKEVATTKSVLLALLGGICSLFLGCSFVTPIEFSYFFTVRLPSFFRNETDGGDSCPASPRRLRDPQPQSIQPRQNRFPSVRTQNRNVNFINIKPSDIIIGDKNDQR